MTPYGILILDHNAVHRVQFMKRLRSEGYVVWSADTVEEAKAIVLTRRIDVFLCDLPSMQTDEWSRLKDLWAMDPGMTTMLLSGNAEREAALAGLSRVLSGRTGADSITEMDDAAVWKSADPSEIESDEPMDFILDHRFDVEERQEERVHLMTDLESKYPGITKINRDANGFLIIGD